MLLIPLFRILSQALRKKFEIPANSQAVKKAELGLLYAPRVRMAVRKIYRSGRVVYPADPRAKFKWLNSASWISGGKPPVLTCKFTDLQIWSIDFAMGS
jgi:hypothetical protein